MKPEIKDYIDCYFKKQKYAPPKIVEDAFESLISEVWEAAVKHTEDRLKNCLNCKHHKEIDHDAFGLCGLELDSWHTCLIDQSKWVAYDK